MAAETAINMEDALISGLLSTLNEEAHEDIITDELLVKAQRKARQLDRLYELFPLAACYAALCVFTEKNSKFQKKN
jgi:hypothetical protein